MKLTILSDDRTRRKDIIAKHSLSVLIEKGNEVFLFDMGVDPSVLEHNIKALDKNIDIVDYVVVSHEHSSHYGGFRYVSSEAPYTDVFIPYGSMESLGRLLLINGMKPREVVKWIVIGEGVYISKPYYGPPYEHFLIIEHNKGLIVLTGCMHPGVEVLSDIKSFLGNTIYVIVGGFHLSNAPEDVVEKYIDFILNKVEPEMVIPLHCSGWRFIERLKNIERLVVTELTAGDSFIL